MDTRDRPLPATLCDAVALHARIRPTAPAFSEAATAGGADAPDRITTYAQAADRIDRIAGALATAGVSAGDRVAVRLPKSVDGMLLFLAVTRAGAIYVPINPDFTDREAAVLIEDSDPALVVDTGEQATATGAERRYMQFGTGGATDLLALPPGPLAPPPKAGDGAVMLFTSGTTGRPKGAPLTHANLMSNILSLAEAWAISAEDRLLHVLPVFHGHGLFLGIAMMIARGAAVHLMPRFDADETIRRLPDATVFMAVPAIYTRLLDRPAFDRTACAGLRLATSGSAPLSPETFEALRRRMGLTVVERYGLTETCILTTNPIDGTARVGSVGRPLSCVELRIAGDTGAALAPDEVGRVQMRGPSVIDAYWRRPDKRDDWTPEGWFDTGDLGRMDADGFVWLVGRKKDLIITGGFNVYPREVEIQLETLDGVAEAVVFGVPHPDFGEGVMAAVRPEAGKTLDEAQLQAALGDGLAKYKRPKRIVLMDDFPRNQMGKVLKTRLRETHADEFDAGGRGDA